MKVLLNHKLFDLKKKYSKGILSSIILISKKNHRIFIDNLESVEKSFVAILKNENIKLRKINKVKSDLTFNVKENRVLVTQLNGSKEYFNNISSAVLHVMNPQRKVELIRSTKETHIAIKLNIDGKGKSKVETGIGFFNHMLEQISRHGNIDLDINVRGDLLVDEHHTVEDTGIALGEAIKKGIGDKVGIKRYGFLLPMDDSFAKCAIDLGGRAHLNFKCKFAREKVGEFPTELCKEFFKGISMGLNANILLEANGENDHHKIEAMFKSFAKSLNEACRFDERATGALPSTKGLL
jgi:imidazoleglycerol-phosphate dehydratase/histidinol-phosphatase